MATPSTNALAAPITPFRPFRSTVVAVDDLSPHLRRIRFGGPDLEDFGDPGWDQRIKLIVPAGPVGAARLDIPAGLGQDWYAAWLALPDAIRPPMRTYTTRRVVTTDTGRAVDVDVVLHEEAGPAGDWARSARPGDELVLVGPDRRYGDEPGGRAFVPPPGVEHVVLAGDETALPAIARILEDLADAAMLPGQVGPRVTAFVEVPTAADVLELRIGCGATLGWLPRGDAPTGTLLDRAVREWAQVRAAETGTRDAPADQVRALPEAAAAPGPASVENPEDPVWDVPAESSGRPRQEAFRAAEETGGAWGSVYLWIAAESAVVKGIRRHLVTEVGVPRDRVAFMGYWRRGASL